MRKILAVLLMICLLLTGCHSSEDQMQQILDFRTELLSSQGCKFSCVIEADYGENVYNFSLDCVYDGNYAQLTVTEPDNIAGISACVDGSDASLEFDGFSLEFGSLANGHVAPLAIPWLLGSAWTKDYISQVGAESGQIRGTFLKGYHDDELVIDTWFSENIPTYAEILYDGDRVLTACIQNFSFLK